MAEGDIGALIDSLVYDDVLGTYPDIIHVTGEIYAIPYCGAAGAGTIVTVSIDAAGDISAAPLDTLLFDAVYGASASIVHVYAAIYAIAYTGPDSDGWVCTVAINADGSIDDAVIDTLEFAAANSESPNLIHLAGTAFAVVDRGADFDGFIYTFTISQAGAISALITDFLEFYTDNCSKPRIVRINSSFCAVVFADADGDGKVVTLPVSDLGAVGDAVTDTFEFETTLCSDPDILHVSGQVYLIVYQDTDQDGQLLTVNISATGAITEPAIDTFEFTVTGAQTPRLLHISGNLYLISYTDANNDLWVCSVTVAENGTITHLITQSLELDAADGQFANCVYCGNSIYAAAYRFTGGDGKVVTFGVETAPATAQADHLMMLGMG